MRGDEGMAAIALDQRDVAGGDAEFLVEALGRLDHVEFDRVVLVPGIEIDVVLRQLGNRVDCAVIGQFLGARAEPLRVGLAERGLHALIERLRTVLRHGGRPKREDPARGALGAGVRPARDDAGADDVLGVRHLDLSRHVGARGKPRHGGGGEVGAELGQRVRGERLTRERIRSEPRERARARRGGVEAICFMLRSFSALHHDGVAA